MSYSQNQFQEDYYPATSMQESMTPGGGFQPPFTPSSQDQDYIYPC
jgi:hypothetical protein